jgi:hypothetical protein
MNAEIDHADSKQTYSDFMKQCLAAIPGAPEEDIQAFFVPVDGAGAGAIAKINDSMTWAKSVKLAAHRFSNKTIIADLSAGLTEKRFTVALVFDDDIFWAGTTGAHRPNMPFEFKNVIALSKLGAEPRYVQTNEQDALLHHNKFIVWEAPGRTGATLVGAGNYTGDAFEKNLENFYFVTIPDVVAKMSAQYDHIYNGLASPEKDLPQTEAKVLDAKTADPSRDDNDGG